ncbi:MAG: glycosyltransferase family 9 protein [Chloroherpetonaceae bacterium]|nr:glycosyltransferase family 9 protein [Chloroherpetonaceae bacterium]
MKLRLVGLAYKLRKKRFEVLINPVHSRTIWMDNLSRFTGAQWKIASLGDVLNMKEEVKKVTDKFYDELIPVPPDTEFEFFRNKEFTENLLKQAVLLKKPHITIPNSHGKSFRLVVFPGANGSWKTWPLRNYIEICRRLLQDFPKLQIVIAGSSREKGAAHELEISISSSNVLNLAGQASLLEIVKLMQTSVLTVSNESSPVHIAASIRAPVVCISHGKFFGRFDPYPSNIAECITYVYPERISRGYDGEDLIKSISVDKVYRIVKEKIEKAVENISSEAISSKNFIM